LRPILRDVNGTKSLHFLLIAVLLFGQLVTNAHAIEHLQVDDHDHFSHLFHSDEHECAHVSNHFNCDSSTQKVDSDTDCSIYHLLLKHSGGFWNIQSAGSDSHRPGKSPVDGPKSILWIDLDLYPIRGPPIRS